MPLEVTLGVAVRTKVSARAAGTLMSAFTETAPAATVSRPPAGSVTGEPAGTVTLLLLKTSRREIPVAVSAGTLMVCASGAASVPKRSSRLASIPKAGAWPAPPVDPRTIGLRN